MMIKYLLVLLVCALYIKSASAFSCCAPNMWTGYSLSNNDVTGQQFQKNYYYSYSTLSVRIDTIYLDGSFNQSTYTNYKDLTSTGTEWVMNNLDGTCYQTGPDYWNSMCFGDSYGLPYQYSVRGQNVFSNPTNNITVTTDSYCRPVAITNTLSDVYFKFFDLQNVFDLSVFTLPEQCK